MLVTETGAGVACDEVLGFRKGAEREVTFIHYVRQCVWELPQPIAEFVSLSNRFSSPSDCPNHTVADAVVQQPSSICGSVVRLLIPVSDARRPDPAT